jgi:hypothetical protein
MCEAHGKRAAPFRNPRHVRRALLARLFRLMLPFRVIVIDENQTTVLVVPFDRARDLGEAVELPHGERVTVRHVISAARDGLAGIVPAACDAAPASG